MPRRSTGSMARAVRTTLVTFFCSGLFQVPSEQMIMRFLVAMSFCSTNSRTPLYPVAKRRRQSIRYPLLKNEAWLLVAIPTIVLLL